MQPKRQNLRQSIITDAGFSLVELLVALAIIGLIAALATPQVLRYLDGAKVSTTKSQINNIQSALELYYLDTGQYPSKDEGLSVLVRKPDNAGIWNGPYLRGDSAIQDAWNGPFQYEIGESGTPKVISLGRDLKPGGEGLDGDLEG